MKYCYGCMNTLEDSDQVCPVCGYIQNTPPVQTYYLRPGTVIRGRYLVGKVIGYGGFGISYVGFDMMLKRKVAVKEYFPSDYAVRIPGDIRVRCSTPNGVEAFRRGLDGFTKEAKSLARLGEIRGVVKVFDCVDENNTAYIIMEFLEGKSLKEVLTERGRIPYPEARHYIMGILFTLAKIHKEGVIHRDIAPDNIFLLKNRNELKLIDFGSARYAFSEHSKSISVILKPGYAPFEQYISNSRQGPWTDLYSVGATFYRMVTGEIPIEASARAVNDRLVRPSMLCRIPPEGEAAIMKALQIKSEMRYQNAEAFMQDLMVPQKKQEKLTPEISRRGGTVKLEAFVGTPQEMKKSREAEQVDVRTEKFTGDAGDIPEQEMVVLGPHKKPKQGKKVRTGLILTIVLLLLLTAAAVSFILMRKQGSTERLELYSLSEDDSVKSGRIVLKMHTETGEQKLQIRDDTGLDSLQLYISRSADCSREELEENFSDYAQNREGTDGFICFAFDEIGYDVDFSKGGCRIDVPDLSGDKILYDLTAGSGDQAELVYTNVSFKDICGMKLGTDEDKADLVLFFTNLTDEKADSYKVHIDTDPETIQASVKTDAYANPDESTEKVFTIQKNSTVIVCGEYEKKDGSRWKLIRRNAVYGFVSADEEIFES